MDRSDILEMMGSLKLSGLRTAFDEVISIAAKRQHEPQRLMGDPLKAEIDEKHARSIRYELTIARLPLAKDIADFGFAGKPIDETLVHDLAAGHFLAERRLGDAKMTTVARSAHASLRHRRDGQRELALQ